MNQDEFKKIILRAIENEIEAFTFYRTVSDKANDKKLKNLFDELAGDEAKHKITLEGFLTKAPERLHFSTSHDYKVVDALPTPPLTADLKLSPTAEAFLVKGKPSYYGDAMLGDFAWSARGDLSKLLRTGKALMPAAYSDGFEPTWAGVAASNLADWQRQVEGADALWDKIGVGSENLKSMRILDVGCGAALLSFALVKRNQTMKLTAIDRPMVLPYVKQIAEAMGVASQVTLQAGDAVSLDLRSESFDVILFGNITDYLSPEQNIGMLRKAYEALVPNGRVILVAPISDDDRKGPGQVPMAGIDLLLFSPDGDVYTFVEYRGMLETAGFSEVMGYKDDWGLVSARRIDKQPIKNDK